MHPYNRLTMVRLGAVALFTLAAACDDDAGETTLDAGADAAATADASVGDTAMATCPTITDLPARIETSLTVGPGCVRAGQTDIRNGAVLTIAPGTTVLMNAGAHFDVGTFGGGGTLVSVGTAAAPIRFTSAAASPLPGDWQCIYLGSGAVDSDIQFTTFEYGGALCKVTGSDDNLASVIIVGGIRKLSNSTVRKSLTHGVSIKNEAGVREFTNNRFEDNGTNGEASLWVAQNEVITLGAGLTFTDADDYIRLQTTFSAKRSGTWLAHPVPYRATELDVSDMATITLSPGVRIQLSGGTVEIFNANLIAMGTAEAPVVFTSANPTPQAGDWGCIWLSSVQGTPSFSNTIIEYGGNGQGCSGANYRVAVAAPASTQFAATKIRNIAGGGIRTTADCTMIAPLCTAVEFSMLTEPALQCGGTGTPTACP